MRSLESVVIDETSELPQSSPPHHMSYEEYLDWDHEGGLAEWVDGEVIVHDMPLLEHQRVVVFLDRLLGLFVQLFGLGVVYTAPFTMRLAFSKTGREPDVFFVASENESRLLSRQLDGPADLVVEVISPDSVTRDRKQKFAEYETVGVREYWIIDPRPSREHADFYVLDENGQYQPVPIDENGIYRSTVIPHFWLNVAWLWMRNPQPLAALAEIVGTDLLISALQAGMLPDQD